MERVTCVQLNKIMRKGENWANNEERLKDQQIREREKWSREEYNERVELFQVKRKRENRRWKERKIEILPTFNKME